MNISQIIKNTGDTITDIIALVQNKVPPDTIEKLIKAESDFNTALIVAQAEINKQESQHSSLFVSGWRPFVGWTCAIVLFLHYFIMPIVHYIGMLNNHYIPQLILPIEQITTLICGMLGVSVLRTVDKIKDVATTAISKGVKK
jgi:hypothetical protein